MSDDQSAQLFAGLTIERSEEALPKRIVAGRESIPNPFVDAVKDSFREAKDAGEAKAVRVIYVPVDKAGTTVRTVSRTDKAGKVTATQWQQHSNVNTALYLLRQAAIKGDVGVRIVVDYAQETVPTIQHTYTAKDKDGNALKNADGTEKKQTVTLKDVTLNKFKPMTTGPKKGLIRIRFVGQAKKNTDKDENKGTPEANAAA